MSSLDVYLQKHEKVVGHLVEAVKQIPEDKLDWKPCERAIPWLHLIHHTAIGRQHLVLGLLQDKEVNFPGMFSDPELKASSTEEAAISLQATWDELKNHLINQPKDYFNKAVVEFPGGVKMTAERFLWMVFEENVHHRGQAWVYARMNGITPPAIWGTERKIE